MDFWKTGGTWDRISVGLGQEVMVEEKKKKIFWDDFENLPKSDNFCVDDFEKKIFGHMTPIHG